jgi:hypothetical protein
MLLILAIFGGLVLVSFTLIGMWFVFILLLYKTDRGAGSLEHMKYIMGDK